MSKKIVVVQPNNVDNIKEHQEESEKYVRDLGYEVLDFSPDEILAIMAKSPPESEFYAAPFIIGATSILMAMAGNVYFGHGWKESNYCADLFQIACKYGLNIVLSDPG